MRTGPRAGFRWTPETIVYAITLWYRKHSRTPFTSEWDHAGENHPSRQTVARVFDDGFGAVVVPHVEASTTLPDKAIGAAVNLEVDMFARYVRRYVQGYLEAGVDKPRPARRGLGEMLKDMTDGR
jgi:hypothetical protein